MSTPVLELDSLSVGFATDRGLVRAVEAVSFSVAPGEVADPYRWLEDVADPRTQAWSQAQDDLFAAAPALGMPLLAARFPRSFVDANREPYELDPGMFEGPLPGPLNHRTTRVAAGLGMIPRVAASGEAIYRGRVPSREIEHRLETCWRPYHTALTTLVEQTYRQFGAALLVDAHSMPSSAVGIGSRDRDNRVDIVLGDNHGEACAPGAP